MSDAEKPAPAPPAWHNTPVIEGVRMLSIGLVGVAAGQPFHVPLDDPRVEVVQDSDGLVHGWIDGGYLIKLFVPQELIDAS
jgi:hypothetical protein